MELHTIFFVSVIFFYKYLSEDVLHWKLKLTQQYHDSNDAAAVKQKRLEMELRLNVEIVMINDQYPSLLQWKVHFNWLGWSVSLYMELVQ